MQERCAATAMAARCARLYSHVSQKLENLGTAWVLSTKAETCG